MIRNPRNQPGVSILPLFMNSRKWLLYSHIIAITGYFLHFTSRIVITAGPQVHFSLFRLYRREIIVALLLSHQEELLSTVLTNWTVWLNWIKLKYVQVVDHSQIPSSPDQLLHDFRVIQRGNRLFGLTCLCRPRCPIYASPTCPTLAHIPLNPINPCTYPIVF